MGALLARTHDRAADLGDGLPHALGGVAKAAGLLALHPVIATPDEGRPDDPDGLRAGLREHWEKQRRIVLAAAAATD
ncbi:hypothetical protein [Kitasatospora sp. NPDC056181]|uniref:hypothetical protein n=1 Tax=Kitasatospora sp. NPDC056181 TaxID=3345737 RepID=UPI0035DB1F4E